jgi:hypothetical protein
MNMTLARHIIIIDIRAKNGVRKYFRLVFACFNEINQLRKRRSVLPLQFHGSCLDKTSIQADPSCCLRAKKKGNRMAAAPGFQQLDTLWQILRNNLQNGPKFSGENFGRGQGSACGRA